jgi:ABC-type transport system substrate-binding protein
MRDGTVDLFSVIYFPASRDPDGLLYAAYHSSAQGLASLYGLQDAALDSLLERGQQAPDAAQRLLWLRQANRYLHEQVLVGSIWFEPVTNVYSDRISGCPASPFQATWTDVEWTGQ